MSWSHLAYFNHNTWVLSNKALKCHNRNSIELDHNTWGSSDKSAQNPTLLFLSPKLILESFIWIHSIAYYYFHMMILMVSAYVFYQVSKKPSMAKFNQTYFLTTDYQNVYYKDFSKKKILLSRVFHWIKCPRNSHPSIRDSGNRLDIFCPGAMQS